MTAFGRLSRILSLPHVRQELFEFFGWRRPDLRQHAGEVALRIQLVTLAAGDERPEPGVVFGRSIVAGEEPVLSSYRHAFQRSFAGIVVDGGQGGRCRCDALDRCSPLLCRRRVG